MLLSGLEMRLEAGEELFLPKEAVCELLLLLVGLGLLLLLGLALALVLLLPPLELRDGLLPELLRWLPPELELCEEDEDE